MAIEIGYDMLVEELNRLQEKFCVGHELSVKLLRDKVVWRLFFPVVYVIATVVSAFSLSSDHC
jgi:hypothetical protein